MASVALENQTKKPEGRERPKASPSPRRGTLIPVSKRRGGPGFTNRLLLAESMVFSKPTREARQLAILQALSNDSSLSQFTLGERSGLSGAMVNSYLKELSAEGLVQFEPLNGKSYRYRLTEKGELLRRNLFAEYCSETIKSYTAIKNSIHARMQELSARGISRVALFGASETCEVALAAIAETSLTVVALLDNDPRKHGKLFHGHVISHPAYLEHAPCEAVVITSYGRQQDIYDQLKPLNDQKKWEIIRL